jgi:TPR repeat protein
VGELDRALTTSNLVVIVGDSKAGKTRTAFEAIKRLFPDRLLLVPTSPASLSRLADAELRLPESLVWLDELDAFLQADALSVGVYDRLTAKDHGNVVLLGTMRSERWADYGPEKDIAKEQRDFIKLASLVRLERRLRGHELTLANELSRDPCIEAALEHLDRYGLGEYLSAGPALLDRFQTARMGADPIGAAIVRAAIDWVRAGLNRPIVEEALKRLCPIYLENANPPAESAFRKSLDWATGTIFTTIALLVADTAGGGYRVSDYLVDFFEQRVRGGQDQVPVEGWQLLLEEAADPNEKWAIGFNAFTANNAEFAEPVWRELAEGGYARAAYALGVLLVQLDRKAEAEPWFRQAAEAGDTYGANNLGLLLKDLDREADAETWFRQAAKAGNASGAYNLGVLLGHLGRSREAEPWYRQAAEASGVDAANAADNLGLLLKDLDRKAEAEPWFRRAAEAGHARATYHLGVLLVALHRKEEAEPWLRQAAEAGDAHAASFLGVLLVELHRKAEAEPWLRQAAEAGDADAANDLELLQELDRKDFEPN